MKTNPQSRKPPLRASKGLLRGLLMLGIGVAAFYGFQIADRAISGKLLGHVANHHAPVDLPVVAPDRPQAAPSETLGDRRAGNAWLRTALVSLEQHQSIAADVVQLGWIDSTVVETHGSYQQAGNGATRRFALQLQGQLAGKPTRLLRVSDGRSLWTDLLWEEAEQPPGRSVTRVDLRRLRRDGTPRASLGPGEAAPHLAGSSDWSRFGGMPMLLAALDTHFDFGPGRRMQLRGESVIALAGRWSPSGLTELGGASQAPPNHAPHHVVIALSETTHFPQMIEYRSANDPLASPNLPDEARLRPSSRPMLKIDLLHVVFDQEIPSERFVYSPPTGVDWQDQTERELRITEQRRAQRATIATKGKGRNR